MVHANHLFEVEPDEAKTLVSKGLAVLAAPRSGNRGVYLLLEALAGADRTAVSVPEQRRVRHPEGPHA